MAQTPVEIEVETAEGRAIFVVPLMDGVKGTKLLVRLSKMLAPLLPQDGAKPSFAALVAGLDPDEFERVLNEVLARAIARFPDEDKVENNAKAKLGVLFEGKSLELMTLLWKALEANYPFVRALGEKLASLVPSNLTGQNT